MLLLQLRIGLIGLFEKLKMIVKSFSQCSHENMHGSIFRKEKAGLSTYLAVGSILLQMNMYTLGDLEKPAPLGLQGVHVGLWAHRKSLE